MKKNRLIAIIVVMLLVLVSVLVTACAGGNNLPSIQTPGSQTEQSGGQTPGGEQTPGGQNPGGQTTGGGQNPGTGTGSQETPGTGGSEEPTPQKHTVTFRQSGRPDKTVEVADLGSLSDEDIPQPFQEKGYNVEWKEADLSSITDDIVVEAKKTAIVYHITYEVGEGTNNPGNPETYTIEDPAFTLLAPIPNRGAFGGWYTGRNGGGEVKTTVAGGEIGNLTLYANWLEYYITVADGFELDGTMLTSTVHNSVANLDLQDKIHVSDNCTWKLYKDYEGNSELPLKAISLQTGHNTAYVIVYSNASEYFTRYTLDIYRLSMREYKFTDRGSTHKSGTIEEDSAVEKATDPARTGYEFKGWAVKGSSAIVDFPYTVKENVEFVAQWTANNYTAHLDPAEGEGLDSADKTVTYDSTYNFPVLTRTGYTFLGWYAGNDKLTGADGRSLAPWTFDENDKAITAKWQANNYTAHLDAANGEGLDGADKTVTYDSAYNFPVLTRTGYTFLGWFAGEDKLTEADGQSIAPWTFDEDNKDITAKWQANNYTAHLDAANGEGLDSADKTVTYDSAYNFPVLTRTGYTFLGWFAGEDKLTEADGQSIAPWTFDEDNKAITAKWQANKYSLKVESNNSSRGSVTGEGDFDYDSEVTITATTNPGYTFVGWYDSEDKKVESELEYTFTKGLDETYTAKWIKVTLEASTGGSVTELTGTYIAGEQITYTAETDPGYTFIGWYNEESGKLSLDLAYETTMTDKDTTYTAKWIKVTLESEFGGSVTQLTGTYIAGETVTLTAKPYPSYTFDGWYSAGEMVYSDMNCTMPEVDTTYTAHWKVRDDMSNFEFTSTIDTCQITGVKDKSVQDIIVPDCVTEIKEGAFSGCGNLTSITLPFVGDKPHTAEDTYQYPLGYIFGTSEFSGGTRTRQYYYGSRTSSTTSTAYYIPTSLKTVIITGSNYLPYGAFYECSNLIEITIPASVTFIGGRAFYNCSGLTETTIPASVTSIGDRAFYKCTNLQTVNWNATNCTYAGSYVSSSNENSKDNTIFYGCTSLTTVNIGENVQTIPAYAFYNCNNITSITLPANVTSIGDSAFYGWSGLTKVNITDLAAWCNIDFDEASDNPLYNGADLYINDELQEEITIPQEVTEIKKYTFRGCTSITGVTIHEDVTFIGDSAFGCCTNLQTVNWNATNCTYAGDAISIFYNCTSLTTINIGANVETIPADAFYCCGKITEITIPASVTSIGNRAFANWINLQTVKFAPDSRLKSIGNYAFGSCSNLTSITIPSSVTSIGKGAFHNCTDLNTVTFEEPNGWKVSENSDMSFPTTLSSSSLQNSATAVMYLRGLSSNSGGYADYYWHRY